MTALIRILLVDDHAVVREGYKRLLDSTGRMAVVAEASNADEAYGSFVSLAPDLVILDLSLPGASGFDVLRRILGRNPRAQILIFSMHEDPVFVRRALDRGARGYLSKASAPENMLAAVHAITSGQVYVPKALREGLAHRHLEQQSESLDRLSEREFEILRLMASGLDAAGIAEIIFISTKTVANYQTAIRHKLRARNLREVVHRAILAGLLSESEFPVDNAAFTSGKTPLLATVAADKIRHLSFPFGAA